MGRSKKYSEVIYILLMNLREESQIITPLFYAKGFRPKEWYKIERASIPLSGAGEAPLLLAIRNYLIFAS